MQHQMPGRYFNWAQLCNWQKFNNFERKNRKPLVRIMLSEIHFKEFDLAEHPQCGQLYGSNI